MRHTFAITLAGMLAAGSHRLAGQDTTALGCDARCVAAVSSLTAGVPVDIWAIGGRVQGRFVRLDTDASAPPILHIRPRLKVDSSLRAVPADEVHSIYVGRSNTSRFALYGAGAGIVAGGLVALVETDLNFLDWMWVHHDRGIFDGRRVATELALGAAGGAVAGALLGSRIPRWERRFARPLGR